MANRIFILPVFLMLLPFYAASQTADFTFQSNTGVFCNPTTITFTQTCTGSPTGFIWDFGNNTTGYSAIASATYTTAGTFTVKLTAIYNQTSSEIIKTIVINPTILPTIGFDRNYICIPGAINFSGNSNGNITNYAWDFGDTTGTINALTKDIAHNYANFGNYQVNLKVTDINGCTGTATTPIKVNKPAFVAANASPANGCIPANVNFNATVNVPLNGAVSSYSWNYGDGSPANTTATNITSHSYPLVGSYSPTLSIITNEGCTNNFNFPAIAFGTPPINHIAYPKKTVVCGSENPVFVSKAINANRYDWNFGDGTTGFTTDTLIQHKYTTLGFKTVSVTPLFNGCPGTTISFQIEVVGVIAKFTYSNTCASKKTYSFTNTSLGTLSSVLWNFGDNSSIVTTANAIHTFPATGQFATTLTVTDSVTGCSDNFSQLVYTADPVLVNTDSAICRYTQTTFTVSNSYTSNATVYNWNILGIKIGTSNFTIGVNTGTLGVYNNFVSINYGPQSCPDTVRLDHPIIVKGPDLNFTSPATLCFNNPVNITNLSKPFIAADSINLWYWNYGEKITNDTTYQPLTFQYQNPGSYQIKLTAFDIRGCKDSLIKIVTINPLPFLRIVPQIDTMCLGQPVAIQTFSNSSFLWTPAATLSCNSCDSAIANPSITTKYYVKATTAFNCNVDDSALVKVYAPFNAVSPANNYYICRNETVQLDIGPKTNLVTWSPPAGLSSTTSFTPIAAPQQSTNYVATISDSVGCFSSTISINVIVKSLPTVDAGPDKTLPYNSSFTITPTYSNNVASYTWTPATQLFCNNCASPVGTALSSENYLIKVTSDSGCVANDNISIFVECKNANILLPKAFSPNNDNLNDYYYPLTRGIKSITKFLIYNREGKVVYEAKNFVPNSKSFAWNGTYKGQFQQSAAYVYILEAICDQGQILTQKGSFLLLR